MKSSREYNSGKAPRLTPIESIKVPVKPSVSAIQGATTETSDILSAVPLWQLTIIAAKTAHKNGDIESAKTLYRAGLEEALAALGESRTELVDFLTNHIWS